MKKILLSVLVLVLMTGAAMAQEHRPVHHPIYHRHHHPVHHRPIHHGPVHH